MTKRTVLVSGASRGLGLELVRQHIRRGDQVFALVRHRQGPIQNLDGQPDLQVLIADVADSDRVRQAFTLLQDMTDHLDIVYNNAAIYRLEDRVPLRETQLDYLPHMYNINAVGPLRVSQQALPFLRRGSVIMNISSEAGSLGQCWRKMEYAYAMSKTALNMATRILANDLADQGIRVLAVHPGWLRTDMGGSNASDDPSENAACLAELALHAEQIPAERIFMNHKGEEMPW